MHATPVMGVTQRVIGRSILGKYYNLTIWIDPPLLGGNPLISFIAYLSPPKNTPMRYYAYVNASRRGSEVDNALRRGTWTRHQLNIILHIIPVRIIAW